MRYSIEVRMEPAVHDSPNAPYFWFIRIYRGKSCSNGGHGWAVTPEEAWKHAIEYYNKYYKEG